MQRYQWPGNIRELENVIERAVIVSQGRTLRFDLPIDRARPTVGHEAKDAKGASPPGVEPGEPTPTRLSDLRRIEHDAVIDALKRSAGKVSGPGGAAELMDMKATTLYARIKRMRIDIREFKNRR